MSIQPDTWIREMALEHGMIEPFVDGQVRQDVISYGLSSCGYDIRVADEFKIFTNVHSAVVDPKHFNPKSFIDYSGDVCIIPPNSFVLARTVGILSHSTQRTHYLRRQEYVCTLWLDRQCDAV